MTCAAVDGPSSTHAMIANEHPDAVGFRLHVVPSYRCNLRCAYCYAAYLGTRFSSPLTMAGFSALLSSLVPRGLSSVSFLGGEPSLWEPLGEAIAAVRAQGLKSLLYTNGQAVNGIPDLAILNVTEWLRKGPGGPALRAARQFRERGTRIVLRLNLDEHCRRDHLNDIAQVAQSLQADISLAALNTSPQCREYGDLFFGTCVDLLASSLAVRISRPVPLCSFTAYQEGYLRKHCGLSGVCSLESAVPVVNPDGRTVYPCNSLPVDVGVAYPYDRDSGRETLQRAVARCDRYLPDVCRRCGRHSSGECQCGCHAVRWPTDAASD
ncbi:MAG: radical SAM protein [Anaerolineae bacterium]